MDARIAVEDAETAIRLCVKEEFIRGSPREKVNRLVNGIISRAVRGIPIPSLRGAAANSLKAFANRQYSTLVGSFGTAPMLWLYRGGVLPERKGILKRGEEFSVRAEAKGIPSQEYSHGYMQKVRAVFDKLSEERALDPGDVSGRNSLKNLAEMETRYRKHLDSIEELKARGVRLVVASVHEDCSDRCFPWQGRVYSLNGTTGRTEDGKLYVPLERATDIYYTTKAGKTYKNGLLGYNCRHELKEYVPGMAIPRVTKAEQQREQAVNARQRELEKRVRNYRERALMYRDVDDAEYKKARQKALYWNKEYKRFSRANGRAYYPDRAKVLLERPDGKIWY